MHVNTRPVRFAAVLVSLSLTAAACGSDSDNSSSASTEAPAEAPAAEPTSAPTAAPDDAAADTTAASAASIGSAECGDGSFESLVEAAEAEGKVNLIALPDTWANYEGILESFRTTYDVEAPVANPDASSADELTAIRTLRGQPDMPEAVDVGPSFTGELMADGLVDAFKPSTWDEIPDALKDPDGYWVGAYYGVMSIATNSTLVENVPTSFEDLKDPAYANMITLNGDPREAGAAFAAVMAASLANGGSFDDIMPGIEYFAELKELGNLQVIDVTPAALISGEVPIALDWTYNFPALVPQLEEVGFDLDVVVPSDGVYASYYAQGVVSEANHPCAARLWIEHIVGDDGALGYLEGGAIPARYAALVEAGLVSDELAANLPSGEVIESITFPSQEQIDAAKTALTENWGPMVADS
jgi:putative spermidine/putrescine transport system substrate-binding protein